MHTSPAVLVAIDTIRVCPRQEKRVSRDKVKKHLRTLEQGDGLFPIDLHQHSDGTFTIAGNGRHRYFAYLYAGLTHVPAIVHN